ncbi:MAG TPA: acetylglutamate kinase [Longimicrobiales bacterium]
MKVRVVKVGGRVLGEPAWLSRFAELAARAGGRLVVVHGGGPEVDDLCGRLGIGVERSGGLRVTTPEALDAASMVLSGRLNKRLVRVLVGAGVDALGVSGEDAGLVVAEPAANRVLGRVGENVRVRADLLRRLLGLGVTPVISPISGGTDGGALNVNADDVATAVAAALGAIELLFITDVPAVHDGKAERATLDAAEAAVLLSCGIARDGMAVKLTAGLRALRAGVPAVRIGPVEALADSRAGTWLGRTVGTAGLPAEVAV